ncbi:hypothetical protein COEREDRAFT_83695 [Coemansia reversa NRRL 1564]|uniref:Uncharacterized protein n=1 Tax=Coemansia reversa (strain ATCC 12441 / NRRL 1564) TaxID=763665 RepID=A0A2G5B277_COERN|nr:hypothetical protein COEREDRAFT_83695 [Coemansia reversa NRRL 1564]|eukprot:PIA13122.1 hypothetical protein COEREDRAFT_83695 [Coemansia reversa NRRL 1564]
MQTTAGTQKLLLLPIQAPVPQQISLMLGLYFSQTGCGVRAPVQILVRTLEQQPEAPSTLGYRFYQPFY